MEDIWRAIEKVKHGKGETNAARFAKITSIDRFVSIPIDAHLAAVVDARRTETLRGSTLRFSRLAWACLAQQLHAVHKVRSRGGSPTILAMIVAAEIRSWR